MNPTIIVRQHDQGASTNIQALSRCDWFFPTFTFSEETCDQSLHFGIDGWGYWTALINIHASLVGQWLLVGVGVNSSNVFHSFCRLFICTSPEVWLAMDFWSWGKGKTVKSLTALINIHASLVGQWLLVWVWVNCSNVFHSFTAYSSLQGCAWGKGKTFQSWLLSLIFMRAWLGSRGWTALTFFTVFTIYSFLLSLGQSENVPELAFLSVVSHGGRHRSMKLWRGGDLTVNIIKLSTDTKYAGFIFTWSWISITG